MSMPAGWYDDGSGNQRWWDGEHWTSHLAPEQSPTTPARHAAAHDEHGQEASAPTGRAAPVLGFVGLGLAAVGTILACIPMTFLFFLIGVILLLAGLVVSTIGLFTKNAAKWPSIAGMILSVVGGVVGTVVILVTLTVGLASAVDPDGSSSQAPTTSSPQVEEQPSDDSGATPSATRMPPEEIAVKLRQLLLDGGVGDGYERMPDFYPCASEFLYNSDISDETLRIAVEGGDGDDIPADEYDIAYAAVQDAVFTCDPDGEGAWG